MNVCFIPKIFNNFIKQILFFEINLQTKRAPAIQACGGSKAWPNAQDLRSCPSVGSRVQIPSPALILTRLLF